MSLKLTLTVTKRKFYKLLTSLCYDVGDYDYCLFYKSKNYKNRYYFRSNFYDFTIDFFAGNVCLNYFKNGKIDTIHVLTLDQIEQYKLVKAA